jgi:hypothetical protein
MQHRRRASEFRRFWQGFGISAGLKCCRPPICRCQGSNLAATNRTQGNAPAFCEGNGHASSKCEETRTGGQTLQIQPNALSWPSKSSAGEFCRLHGLGPCWMAQIALTAALRLDCMCKGCCPHNQTLYH